MARVACAVALLGVLALSGCSSGTSPNQAAAAADSPLPPFAYQLNGDPGPPASASVDVSGPPLDLRVTKSMIYAAAVREHLNPNLAMALGWWESGWNQSAVSSAGAIGIMQIMPDTGRAAGPYLLHRQVDITNIDDNIELGCAIIRHNLESYRGDLVKALADYYGGGIYHLALAFQDGQGPV